MAAKLIWIALGALVLIAGCGGLANQREEQARAEYPPIGQLLNVDGTQVHAWTRGSGPDVVLLHGAGGNLRDFTFDLAKRLSRTYRVTAFDRPGLGWTDRLPGFGGTGNTRGESPVEQAGLLQKAAAQIDIRNPIVVGHSYGGAVAMAWGLTQPKDTAALVLFAGVSLPWLGDLDTYYDITGSAVGGATLVPLITALAPQGRIDRAVEDVFAPQSAPEGYAAYIGPDLTIRRASLRANGQQVRTLRPHIVEMSARYRTVLTMPIELLHGTADTTVGISIHSEPLARMLPNARLTRLPSVGHMPHHADPQAAIAAIDRAAARAGLR
ncbi:alpha/beta hydrolase [Rhodobacteraceae bacterium KMM 6894]|nr:alpha/beta hydrolase [Rhodobacteraceae bacterium KMM 6894]